MSALPRHPSRLQLDRYLVEGAARHPSTHDHLDMCARCARQLARMRARDADFLRSHPFESSRLARALQETPAARPGRRFWHLRPVRLALALAPALAVVALLALNADRSVPDDPVPGPTERAKGGSIVELAVQRDTRSFDYLGQSLHPGDVLAFRYTTEHSYLLLLSVEASGRPTPLLAHRDGHSLAIAPGRGVTLSQGVELDDYVGSESLLMFLSDRPLLVHNVIDAVAGVEDLAGFATQLADGRAQLGPASAPVAVELLFWRIDKEVLP